MDFLDDPEENDLYLFKVSLSPPSHPPPPADPGCCSWVLLDRTAYVADHTNATTANTFFTTRDRRRRRREIRVTFFPAPPPRVSHFCVHCPSMKPECFAVEPLIIATHEELVLLRVAIGRRHASYFHELHDFFVYRADSSTTNNNGGYHPSLDLLPHPGDCYFFDCQVGITHCDDGGGGHEFRDIAAVHGYIKYVEIQSYISDGFAATWSRKITLEDSWEGDWRKDCELHVSDISGSLPELLGDEEARTAQLNLQCPHRQSYNQLAR
uniref:DUF1618 domain-containing protein n=1 Tax=Oryza nivara TaxID=4536 RepID=A0A0E0INM9_ORYNI